MELNIATAPRRDSNHWHQSTVSWDEIITWMIDPADRKEAGNYILGTLQETERTHRGQPCTDLHRCREAVVSRDALMMDVDFPEDDFLPNLRAQGVRTLVHTTFSSTPTKPRYRVIMPLSRPVTPFEYEAAVTHVMEQVGASSFDPGSSQADRYMFKPAGEHFDFWVYDGPIMEPPAVTPETALQANLLPQGKRDPFELTGSIGAFNRTYTDLDHLIEEFDLPYEQDGPDRWRYKGTVSPAGVSSLGNGLWWSSHETDPASGHAQTAFDLVRIHMFGSADATAKPGTPVNDLPSQKVAQDHVEAIPAVRQNQLDHDFGPASPVKTLGYDTDSPLDDDLARNLADRGLDDSFRYVEKRGWLQWDGQRWQDCDSLRLWDPVSRAIRTLAEEWFTTGKNNGQITKLRASLDVPKLKRLIENLRSVLLLPADALDAHPDLLNVANGTVDLRTGTVHPHRREDYLTVTTATPYVPGARHADWDTTLGAMRADTIPWMQLRCGQAATGHRPPDDIMPILQGGGANGKTTFTGAISKALGGHAVFLSERALFGSANDHPTELMDLRGARFALLEETPEGGALNAKRLKDVLGADKLKARLMRQDTEEFTVTHSLFMTTNYHPNITETDEGTWRRMALVEFPYTYLPNAQGDNARTPDPHLRSRMERGQQGQHEAVLAWLVEGAMAWYAADGLLPDFPTSVADNMAAWRAASDPIHSYLTDRLVKDPGAAVRTGELYEDFCDWQEREGMPVWNDRLFASRVKKHEGMKALGAENYRMTPTAKNPELTLHQLDALAPPPAGQVRVWKGIRFKG